jgi:hypothetical protein
LGLKQRKHDEDGYKNNIEERHDVGDRGSTVVKVLRYKSEGRWFDSRWCLGIFR